MAPVPPGGRRDPCPESHSDLRGDPVRQPGHSERSRNADRLRRLLVELGATGTEPRGAVVRGSMLRMGSQLEGSQLDPGPAPGSPARGSSGRLPTGLGEIDRLLAGGIPGGRLSEICGAPSSGRTSLVLHLLAATTGRGDCVAVVDRADAFDPLSARAAGVDLERVLWARAPEEREALRCSERLLETEGFPLVVLDLDDPTRGVERSHTTRRSRAERSHAVHPSGMEGSHAAQTKGSHAAQQLGVSDTAWLRLARRATATRTALVVLSRQRRVGAQAELTLEMQPVRARFRGRPALLEEIETHAVLVRHRSAPTGCATPVRWRTDSAA